VVNEATGGGLGFAGETAVRASDGEVGLDGAGEVGRTGTESPVQAEREGEREGEREEEIEGEGEGQPQEDVEADGDAAMAGNDAETEVEMVDAAADGEGEAEEGRSAEEKPAGMRALSSPPNLQSVSFN
jgi:hypothetical protein